MPEPTPPVHLPPSVRHKLDILFDGIRYSPELGQAAAEAFPNYYPYRFRPDEPNPSGQSTAPIPYLLSLEDGTLVRVRGDGSSPWRVATGGPGYLLAEAGDDARELPVSFEPLPGWMRRHTSDGFPMARAGIDLHGDMAVINVAPGCEYFSERVDGRSTRCTFCAYGAPGERARHFGQVSGQAELPARTLARMQETLSALLEESPIRHVYLVGGSMLDWRLEGDRYVELARKVQEVNQHQVPVSCGSGALPQESLAELHGEGLVDSVCFNLEIWSPELFARVAPGKDRFVGYEAWLGSLEKAVALWGRGRVYSAMVAGIELEPEHGLSAAEAAELALAGAEDLCARGVLPVYSLFFPVGGQGNLQHLAELRGYFERLAAGYQALRRQYGLSIWDGFMCHRCAYMQVECDLDRAPQEAGPPC